MKLKKKEISEIETLQQNWQQKKKANKHDSLQPPIDKLIDKNRYQNPDQPVQTKQYNPINIALDQSYAKKQESFFIKPLNRLDKKIPLKYLNYFNIKNRVHTETPDKEFPIISFSKNMNEFQEDPTFKRRQQKSIKKNTMLLNQMIEILKNGNQSPTGTKLKNLVHSRPKRIMTEGSYQNFNQFTEKDTRKRMTSSKNARPVIIENQITRVSNLGNTVIRRNLKSQQKQRRKVYTMQKKPSQNILPKENKQAPELLTFYGNIKININGAPKESSYPRKIVRNQIPRNKQKPVDDYNQFI